MTICHAHIINQKMVKEVFKPYGVTPKEIVDKEVKLRGATKGAFSGRLDPMACGVMKVYFDDECKLANADDKLSKIYRFVMVFGISSTSYDLLGFPSVSEYKQTQITKEMLEAVIKPGEIMQKQPVHSSCIAKNKDGIRNPLWWWALNNRLDEVAIPSFKRTLQSCVVNRVGTMTFGEILETAVHRIGLIDKKHTFKQEEIINAWNNLEISKDFPFYVAELTASVSSGFYIRQLVNDIGDALGIKTVTFEIDRLSYM